MYRTRPYSYRLFLKNKRVILKVLLSQNKLLEVKYMRIEKIMLVSEELRKISKDFINGYKGINIELNSKEINGVFTDFIYK